MCSNMQKFPEVLCALNNQRDSLPLQARYRNRAAILLYNTLRDFLHFTEELFNSGKTESEESLRYQLRCTVSDFAFTHLESNVWSEILPKLSALVMSTNSPKRAVALKILAAMVPVLMTTLEKNAEQIANIVKFCMAASELDVR